MKIDYPLQGILTMVDSVGCEFAENSHATGFIEKLKGDCSARHRT